MELFQKIILVLASSLAFATPIIFAGIGGLYSEKSGVVNVGLEGIMIIGAFVASLVSVFWGEALGGTKMVLVALIAAAIAGGLFTILHAVATISFKANQIISGIALNMLASAISIFIVKLLFDGFAETPNATTSYTMNVNIAGYEVNWTFFLILVLVGITSFIFNKTKVGLRIRAVGENPSAIDSAGISVEKLRYAAVIVGGMFAGIGGAITVLSFSNGRFSALTISGLGFLGLASLVFGQWKPWGVFFAALFFGISRSIAETIIYVFPIVGTIIPTVILKILPYVLTILALIIFSRKAQAPLASGKSYDKGMR